MQLDEQQIKELLREREREMEKNGPALRNIYIYVMKKNEIEVCKESQTAEKQGNVSF